MRGTGRRKYKFSVPEKALSRPRIPDAQRRCIVTYTGIDGKDDIPALTLWDSGSNTTGFSPAYAYVAKLEVRRLSKEIPLQLGTVGSRSVIQFGVLHRFSHPALSSQEPDYADIINLDIYQMLIGTPTMRKYGVVLDFEANCVRIGDHTIPGIDGRAKWTTEDIPQLREGWLTEYADIMEGVPERMPRWREVNHEINLIDDKRLYTYYRPRCPDSLRAELREKTERYLRAQWWE
ncbi:hypothetical protein CYLTODRAFT_358714, partial [Cylindrobasidium torrendii FP15055 ss-10]